MIIQFHLVEIFYSIFLNFKNIFNSTISDERRTKVMKMLDKNPDKFKQAFKDYMKSKEIDCLQAKVKERGNLFWY